MPSAGGHPNPPASERGAPPTPAAILLAAGRGSRFGVETPKLLAELDGKPLIRWAIDTIGQAGLAPPYVVTGGADLSAALDDVIEVLNPQWNTGLASSLRAGIDAASRDGYEAVVVALADQPRLAPDAWRSVAAAAGSPIAVATYSGVRGHPVRLAAEVWDALPDSGEEGARLLMRDRPELVMEVPCNSGSPLDVDTAEDLERFNSPTHFA